MISTQESDIKRVHYGDKIVRPEGPVIHPYLESRFNRVRVTPNSFIRMKRK